MQSCANSKADIVKVLLDHGADHELTNEVGETAMDITRGQARRGSAEILALLVSGWIAPDG
jgi:ankyrin repeat protein